MRYLRAALVLSLILVFASILLVSMNVRASPTHGGGGGGGKQGGGEKLNPQTRLVQVQVIVAVEVISKVTNVNPVVEYAAAVITATSHAPVASESETVGGLGLIGLAVSGIGMATVAVLLTVATGSVVEDMGSLSTIEDADKKWNRITGGEPNVEHADTSSGEDQFQTSEKPTVPGDLITYKDGDDGELAVQKAKDMQKNMLETYQKMEKARQKSHDDSIDHMRS